MSTFDKKLKTMLKNDDSSIGLLGIVNDDGDNYAIYKDGTKYDDDKENY